MSKPNAPHSLRTNALKHVPSWVLDGNTVSGSFRMAEDNVVIVELKDRTVSRFELSMDVVGESVGDKNCPLVQCDVPGAWWNSRWLYCFGQRPNKLVLNLRGKEEKKTRWVDDLFSEWTRFNYRADTSGSVVFLDGVDVLASDVNVIPVNALNKTSGLRIIRFWDGGDPERNEYWPAGQIRNTIFRCFYTDADPTEVMLPDLLSETVPTPQSDMAEQIYMRAAALVLASSNENLVSLSKKYAKAWEDG